MVANLEPLMTVTEVAAGLHVGRMTVNRMIHRRELRAARVGKLWRIPFSEYERVRRLAEVATDARDVEVQAAQQLGVSTSANPGALPADVPVIRIFEHRPWETHTDGAASPAAGRARSAGKRKTASQRH